MVGHGDHPLNDNHYDEFTLHEYVLGQLLPDDEQAIRQHLASCADCRMRAMELEAFCRQLTADLHRKLDSAQPGSKLGFDHIAKEWRKPPRRVTLWYQAQEFVPRISPLIVTVLLVVVLVSVFPIGNTAALRGLELADNYTGPASIIAAVAPDSLVVVRLAPDDVRVVAHFDRVQQPRNLCFSPDGRWLAFQDGQALQIVQTFDGGLRAQFDVNQMADWAWSPDSDMLAYTDGTGQLAVFDVATQTSRVLVPAEEAAWGVPVWAADSQQLAYASVVPLPTQGGPRLQQGLWRLNVTTGYRVEIARNADPGAVILIPTAWVNDDTALLAWDMNADVDSSSTQLYQIDMAAHNATPVEGHSLAQGTRLLWPVSAQGMALVYEDQLVALNFAEQTRQPIPDQIPWPQGAAWSPNGAWLAYTVAGAPEGQGLYVFALQDGKLRQIELPAGASEKQVVWAGMEHLFVIRQRPDLTTNELWLVSLTTGEAPVRILSGIQLPRTVLHNGWRWQDVLATQVLPS